MDRYETKLSVYIILMKLQSSHMKRGIVIPILPLYPKSHHFQGTKLEFETRFNLFQSFLFFLYPAY